MRLLISFFILLGCSHQVRIVPSDEKNPRTQHEAKAPDVMVSTQGEATTKAGLDMFERGGNIIDAFVAASFAISVERPQSTGIGGGGFLVFYSAQEKKVYAFDFREVAPLHSYPEMYLDKKGAPRPLLSQDGPLAVATPGLVKGLFEIHQKWGKLSWAETIKPAIKLAREGFPMYEHLLLALEDRKSVLLRDEEFRETFFQNGFTIPSLGTLVKQENLAKTLETIARQGEEGFYQGKVADAIIKTVRSQGGILSYRDLRDYQMKERTPVVGTYKGAKIFSMPPPSSGGIHVIQILKMLENHQLKKFGPQTTESVHLTALSMQRAFLDRALYLGDPDFHPVPVKELLNEKYLAELAEAINHPVAIKGSDLKPISLPEIKESTQTVHFSLADKEGNLVASTQTINGWFGSGVIARGTGIILNNEMDDFAQKIGAQNLFGAVGGKNNLVSPKKRPLSSMSPTVVLKNNRPFMALGSPSGTRIITCVAQTLLNTLEFEMPLYEAVAATRIHHQWMPDELKVESPFLHPQVEKELSGLGHKVVHEKLGCSIQAIQREGDHWVGVSDPRGEGLSKGY
jgi:gamma-glutamyltranspeptidase/glutathione hydrolase